jgi:hypothetical protein
MNHSTHARVRAESVHEHRAERKQADRSMDQPASVNLITLHIGRQLGRRLSRGCPMQKTSLPKRCSGLGLVAPSCLTTV